MSYALQFSWIIGLTCLNFPGGGQNVCRPKKYPCNSCISLRVYSTFSLSIWAMAGGRSLVVTSVLSTSLIFAAAIEINRWHEISVCGIWAEI